MSSTHFTHLHNLYGNMQNMTNSPKKNMLLNIFISLSQKSCNMLKFVKCTCQKSNNNLLEAKIYINYCQRLTSSKYYRSTQLKVIWVNSTFCLSFNLILTSNEKKCFAGILRWKSSKTLYNFFSLNLCHFLSVLK